MYNNNIFESEVNILLECKNLVKDYQTSNEVVHALKGVSVTFRDNEFVVKQLF